MKPNTFDVSFRIPLIRFGVFEMSKFPFNFLSERGQSNALKCKFIPAWAIFYSVLCLETSILSKKKEFSIVFPSHISMFDFIFTILQKQFSFTILTTIVYIEFILNIFTVVEYVFHPLCVLQIICTPFKINIEYKRTWMWTQQ